MAEPVPGGKYITGLQKLAEKLNIHLIAGLTELSEKKIYNSVVIIDSSGNISGRYRKIFLCVDEKKKYTAGSTFPVFQTVYGKIGMMMCFDRRKKESITELKNNGVELMFCLAGGGFGPENDNVVCLRSKEGEIPIVFVHPAEFLLTGPKGEILDRSFLGSGFDDNINESYGGIVKLYDVKIRK